MRGMACWMLSCLVGGFFLCASAAPARGGEKEPCETRGLEKALNAFAFDLYSKLTEEKSGEKGNVFFSPYSVAAALAMTGAGARGETAEELTRALRFDPSDPHFAMKSLLNRLESRAALPETEGELSVANRVWVDEREKLLPEYAAFLRENYGGEAGSLNFLEDPEGAREAINGWVALKTRNKIEDLLRKGDVQCSTRLILTDAIYFRSPWREPFEAKLTKEEPFRFGPAERKDVPLMRRTGLFLYGEEPGLQWVKIPYRLAGLSLLVLLPRENETFTQLSELEKRFSPETFAAWTEGASRRRVSLYLPKFRDEGRYRLEDALQKLGVKTAFTKDADFSRMVEDARDEKKGILRVDSVIHQSFIELDEKGTEAAAATAVVMIRATSAALPEEPVEFRADRPFVYCLTDDRTGVILFMGRMVEP